MKQQVRALDAPAWLAKGGWAAAAASGVRAIAINRSRRSSAPLISIKANAAADRKTLCVER
jgi:hypothetical protein